MANKTQKKRASAMLGVLNAVGAAQIKVGEAADGIVALGNGSSLADYDVAIQQVRDVETALSLAKSHRWAIERIDAEQESDLARIKRAFATLRKRGIKAGIDSDEVYSHKAYFDSNSREYVFNGEGLKYTLDITVAVLNNQDRVDEVGRALYETLLDEGFIVEASRTNWSGYLGFKVAAYENERTA